MNSLATKAIITALIMLLTVVTTGDTSFASGNPSRPHPQNAAPLGLEVGYATMAAVKEKIGAVARLNDAGTNQYTNGPMLQCDGNALEIEGLNSILFIFDSNRILAGVIMTMQKNVKETYATLSKKYKPVQNKIDNFMGYGYARLMKGDSFVEIDAPHLSFEMEVRYLTKRLMADFNRQSASDEAKKKQKKADQL